MKRIALVVFVMIFCVQLVVAQDMYMPKNALKALSTVDWIDLDTAKRSVKSDDIFYDYLLKKEELNITKDDILTLGLDLNGDGVKEIVGFKNIVKDRSLGSRMYILQKKGNKYKDIGFVSYEPFVYDLPFRLLNQKTNGFFNIPLRSNGGSNVDYSPYIAKFNGKKYELYRVKVNWENVNKPYEYLEKI